MTAGNPDEAAATMKVEQALWVHKLFISLRHASYRDLWSGTMFSQMAFEMNSLILGWYMLELTDSALWVALVAFANGLPMLLWSPLTGVLADRWERRRIVALAMFLGCLAIAALILYRALSGVLPWHLVALSFLMGSAFSLYAPARSALLAALVPVELLVNASVFQYSSTRLMSFMGPVLAGVLVAKVDVAAAFLVVILSLLAAVLFYRRLPTVAVLDGGAGGVRGVGSGMVEIGRYIRQNGPILEMVLLGLFVVPFGMTYQHLMPVYARDVLHAGPEVLGLLVGMGFLGTALVGFVLTVLDELRKGMAVLLAALLSGIGLMLLTLFSNVPLAIALLFLLGVINGVFLSLTTVLFQALPPDRFRGRLMGVWGTVWGVAPFGALATGAVADQWGVRSALIASGLICTASSTWLLLSGRHLRALR